MDLIEQAQKLYNEKKWKTAVEILEPIVEDLEKQEKAEAHRILGWSFYYLGIKGSDNEKTENLKKAKNSFEIVIKEAEEDDTRISALNGLPLVVWILGEKDDAWELSRHAVKKFPEIPSVWNTRGILCRWGEKFKEALKVNEKVYETALKKGDLRTAGHGTQNLGDTLSKLDRSEEAKKAYEKAIRLYKDYQQTSGKSATFHIESVEKKLSGL